MVKLCNPGELYRKTYTRTIRNGTRIRIPGRCIRSQTRYSSPLKVSRVRLRGYPLSTRTRKGACPPGTIKRSSYVRYTQKGKHVLVPEQCIQDRGLPGKGFRNGPGIGPLRKGELGKFGYADVTSLSTSQRHRALEAAIREYGSLGVWRKLNAVAVYTKHTAPATSSIFKADMKWIRETYGIKAFQ